MVEVELGNNPDAYTFGELYSNALTTKPQVIRDEMSLKSAEMDVEIARGAMLPSLTLFGGMDTRWSSAGLRIGGEKKTL